MDPVGDDLRRALRLPFADRAGVFAVLVGGASLALGTLVSLVGALTLDPVWTLTGTLAGIGLQLPLGGLLLRGSGSGYASNGPPKVTDPTGLVADGVRFLGLGVAVVLPGILVALSVGLLGWLGVPEPVLLVGILAGIVLGSTLVLIGTYVFPAALTLMAVGGVRAAADGSRLWPILRSPAYVVAFAFAWVLLWIATNVVPVLWVVLVGFPLTVALEVSALWLVGVRIRAIEANR